MADIFITVPGRAVVAAKNSGPKGLLFSLPNQDNMGGLVTRISVGQQVAAQMLPSLSGAFYITPFGDQVGTMNVGVILNTLCGKAVGVDTFLRYYRDRRLTQESATPVTMAIGSSTFFGYVTGFQVEAESAGGHIIQGQLSFAAWMAL